VKILPALHKFPARGKEKKEVPGDGLARKYWRKKKERRRTEINLCSPLYFFF
jgi:hypothetical protein